MASYTVEEIKQAVKTAMDENPTSTQLAGLGDIETLTLDDIIESKIEEGVRLVLLEAPRHLLDGGTTLTGTPTWPSELPAGAGRIALPNDFLRLLVFQMSDWAVPATDAVTEDSPQYLLQSSPYAGIRGNTERPVVAIVHTADGQALEFYSSSQTATVRRALYIALPVIASSSIDICQRLYDATVYRIAALTALAIQAGDQAGALMTMSRAMLGISYNNNTPEGGEA